MARNSMRKQSSPHSSSPSSPRCRKPGFSPLISRVAHFLCVPFNFDSHSFAINMDQIIRTMRLDSTDLLLALAFFLRYQIRLEPGSLSLNQSSELLYLLLVLFEVALKVTSDSPFACSQVARAFQLSPDRLMQNELQLLSMLDWRLTVHPDECLMVAKAAGLPVEEVEVLLSSLVFPRNPLPKEDCSCPLMATSTDPNPNHTTTPVPVPATSVPGNSLVPTPLPPHPGCLPHIISASATERLSGYDPLSTPPPTHTCCNVALPLDTTPPPTIPVPIPAADQQSQPAEGSFFHRVVAAMMTSPVPMGRPSGATPLRISQPDENNSTPSKNASGAQSGAPL
ncbi:hypothetical protein PAPYR_2034 [Paratrimastix pyriformis]|uniref:Cyclin N-terminal domain-containing protein n=1 Tax=Paratrimastix pyriformis TaxID=342808 RepID=A0ABQ8UT08_9EUKA|nr:hypothetical protein PAPYR_2034 [Paratrimastix pyriformis]